MGRARHSTTSTRQPASTSEATEPSSHWASMTEAGTYYGIMFFAVVYRCFGRWMFTVCLWPAMAYFVLALGEQRRASIDFLQRIKAHRPDAIPGDPGIWRSYRHFLAFGQAMLDKLIGWTGRLRESDIDLENAAVRDALLDDTRGHVIIGSHFGNLEFCRGFAAQRRSVVINVLLHDRHAGNFARMMRRFNADTAMNVIQVTEIDIGTILRLKECVARGEWIVIAADRLPVASEGRFVPAKFMGESAPFPVGPYVLAATLGCPVHLLFAFRQGKRVKVSFEKFAEQVVLDRNDRERQLQNYAQAFASRLEHYVLRAPLQWFNFFYFWNQDKAQKHG